MFLILAAFLQECHRILSPRGILILTTPNLCAMKNLYYWLSGKQLQYIDYKMGQLGHVRYFSPESIKNILSENGFKIKDIITNGYNLTDYSKMLGWLESFSSWVFSFILRGNCLIVKAVKNSSDL